MERTSTKFNINDIKRKNEEELNIEKINLDDL